MLKRKDVVVIVAVLLVAAAMLGISKLMPKTDITKKTADATLAPDAIEYVSATPAPTAQATEAPEATQASAEETKQEAAVGPMGPMPPKKTAQVRGHVVLTVNGRQYGEPIPMDREKVITLRQEDGKINKVHITPEKVYMEYSSCENQDCVGQGEIHVDTYKTRILSTYIICLPNNVQIEMVPSEE